MQNEEQNVKVDSRGVKAEFSGRKILLSTNVI
jgi:hypothetical protein